MQDRQFPVECATQRLKLCQDNFSTPPNIAYNHMPPYCSAARPSCPGRLLVVTVHKTVVF